MFERLGAFGAGNAIILDRFGAFGLEMHIFVNDSASSVAKMHILLSVPAPSASMVHVLAKRPPQVLGGPKSRPLIFSTRPFMIWSIFIELGIPGSLLYRFSIFIVGFQSGRLMLVFGSG